MVGRLRRRRRAAAARQLGQVAHVAVAVDGERRTGEPAPVDDAGVVQLVREHAHARAAQRRRARRGWRRTRSGSRRRPPSPSTRPAPAPVRCGWGGVPVTSREAPEPAPQRVSALVGGRHHGRMRAQSEIVVGRERHDRPTLEQARRPEGVELPGRAPATLVDDLIQGGPDPGVPEASSSIVRRSMRMRRRSRRQRSSPATSSSPPSRASTIRTISSAVVVSGGISTTTSPSGRSSTPRATAPAHTRRPQRSPGAGGASSTPTISPRWRTSRTSARPATRSPSSDGQLVGPRPHVRQHVPRLDQAQVLERHRRRQRVPPVGMPVVEGLGPEVGAEERAEHLARRHRGRHGQVPAGDPLADAHEVGPQAALLGGEQRPGPPESGRHLVADEQCAGLAARLADPPHIGRGGAQHARRTLHQRLDHDGGQLLARAPRWPRTPCRPNPGPRSPASARRGSTAARTRR